MPSRWAKTGLAVISAAVVAVLVAVFIPEWQSSPSVDASPAISAAAARKTDVTPSKPRPVPAFAVTDGTGAVNEPLPLGIRLSGVQPGASVTLAGLPPGARLSVGQPLGVGEWRVAAEDLAAAAVIPPADFAGAIAVNAELQGAGSDAPAASSVHLSWKAPVAAAVPARPAAPPAESAVRKIDPQEIAGLLKRAQELMAAGDLQPARLLLQRAAEAHHGPAAFALGETYDPVVLKRYGTQAPAADPTLARDWYQKAGEWGVAEAQARLDAMNAVNR